MDMSKFRHTPESIMATIGISRSNARRLGVSFSTFSSWGRRNGIPVKHWRGLLRLAHEDGHTWLTTDVLIDAHSDPDEAQAA